MLEPPVKYYLKKDGSNADRDVDLGAYDIVVQRLIASTYEASPIITSSTILCENLNAELWNGQALPPSSMGGFFFQGDSGIDASTGLSYSNTTKLLSAMQIEITTISGAPILATSTTVCPNLNADLLDGYHSTQFADVAHTHTAETDFVRLDGTTTLTGDWNAGEHNITIGNSNKLYLRDTDAYIYSSAPGELTITGTSHTAIGQPGDIVLGNSTLHAMHPATNLMIDLGTVSNKFNSVRGGAGVFDSIQITSTTVVANLNADLLDGSHAADFSLATHTHTADVTNLKLSGANQASWTPTATIVTSLNADFLDGHHSTYFADFTHTHVADTTCLKLDNSNQSSWTPATTVVANLNADLLDGKHSTQFADVTHTHGADVADVRLDGSNQASWIPTNVVVTSLNADLLDGYDSTYFAEVSHTHAGVYVPVGDYDDADVLAKILNVDGAGSSLDADFLDGHTTTYFAEAGHTHTADVTNLKLDGSNQASWAPTNIVVTSLNADFLDGHDTTYFAEVVHTHAGVYVPVSDYDDVDVLAKLLNVDGTGSSLDADFLDGHSTTYFAEVGHTHTADVTNLKLDGSNQDEWTPDTSVVADLNADMLDGSHLSSFINSYIKRDGTSTTTASIPFAKGITIEYSADGKIQFPGDGDMIPSWDIINGTNLTFIWTGGVASNPSLSAPRFISTVAAGVAPLVVTSPTKVTTLNADMLDGSHSADFSTIGHIHTAYLTTVAGAPLTSTSQVITFNYDTNDFQLSGSNLQVKDAGVDHGGIGGLTDDDHTQYLLAAGTRTLTGDWTIGSHNLTFGTTARAYFTDTNSYIYSSAPGELVVAGATKTTVGLPGNIVLGDSTLRTMYPDTDQKIDLGTATNRFSNALITTVTASRLISTIGAGTAPLTVISDTVVATFNADLWDSLHLPTLDSGKFLTNNGTILSWSTVTGGGGSTSPGGAATQIQYNDTTFGGDAGFTYNKATQAVVAVGTVTANVLISTVAAVAPFTVASTTVVANLNADLLDGSHVASLLNISGTTTCTGQQVFTTGIRLGSTTPRIDFDSTQDAVQEWLSATKTMSFRNGTYPYDVYPSYDPFFCMNEVSEVKNASRVCFSAWITAATTTCSEIYGFWGGCYSTGNAMPNITVNAVALLGYNRFGATNAYTIGNAIGVQAVGCEGGSTFTNVIGLDVIPTYGCTTITSGCYGIRIADATAVAPTNSYGIYINRIFSGGTKNYAIYMLGGDVTMKRDGTKLFMGTGEDVDIQYDGTNWLFDIVATTTAVIWNEGGFDTNFRIEGDTDANLFCLDAGLDKVGIGTAAPGVKLDVSGDLRATTIIATSEMQGARMLLTYNRTSLSPSLSLGNYLGAAAMLFTTTTGYCMPRAGSIVGMGVNFACSAFTTTGTATAQVRLNDVVQLSAATTITAIGTAVSKYITTARGAKTFTAGQLIAGYLNFDTGGGAGTTFAGTLLPVSMAVDIQFDT
jgi:hypothetical protein